MYVYAYAHMHICWYIEYFSFTFIISYNNSWKPHCTIGNILVCSSISPELWIKLSKSAIYNDSTMILGLISINYQWFIGWIMCKYLKIFVNTFWMANSNSFMNVIKSIGNCMIYIKFRLSSLFISCYNLSTIIISNHIHSLKQSI